MQFYEVDEFAIIPMAINAFYYSIPYGAKKIGFAKNISISEEVLVKMFETIEGISKGKYIIIDVGNVDYAFRLFQRFQEIRRPLLFVNINEKILRDKMQDNLPELNFSSDEKSASLNISFDNTVDVICKNYSLETEEKLYAEIVRELIDKSQTDIIIPQKLESSGMYSNMYINVKRLFEEPKKYYAMVYGMAKKLKNSEIEFDGFISSSKNGAILANFLGMMFDKKVIHIFGVGPKYSMQIGNLQRDIKKRKNYIYVYDFVCTGTEMKILSALVNAHEAYINGSIGIATYKTEDELLSKNMMYLVDIKKEGIPYKIAGEREDIVRLMQTK